MRQFFTFFNAFCPIAAFYGTIFHVFAAVLSHRLATAMGQLLSEYLSQPLVFLFPFLLILLFP